MIELTIAIILYVLGAIAWGLIEAQDPMIDKWAVSRTIIWPVIVFVILVILLNSVLEDVIARWIKRN